jgi:hypothetical protein
MPATIMIKLRKTILNLAIKKQKRFIPFCVSILVKIKLLIISKFCNQTQKAIF